jgi:DNA-directed RNA polymerase specialized sigma24 family protein
MDANALKKRDEIFAKRLARQDESVLREIDRAYAPGLRRLLRKARGDGLNDDDIEEILADTLLDVWLKYGPRCGAAVRTYYFISGKANLIDRLRTNDRYRCALEKVRSTIGSASDSVGNVSDVVFDRIERSNIAAQIKLLIDESLGMLTPRQRLAFTHRFKSGNSDSWAKDLAVDQGRSPQYWRKASDEARLKVRDFLTQSGVTYSSKGGQYEITKSRNSA